MVDAVAAIPGVMAAGYLDHMALVPGGDDDDVFADATTDYRHTNRVANPINYTISPGNLAAAGTRLIAGRDLSFDDGGNRRSCDSGATATLVDPDGTLVRLIRN